MAKQKSTSIPPKVTDSTPQVTLRLKKHQQLLYVAGLLILIISVGFFCFKHYQRQQNNVAQNEMFQSVYYFEQESFEKALNGDGIYVGLLDIVKNYPFTQAANLAHFYIGVSYMHQKDYPKAIQHLTRFKSKSLLIQARAWVLMGDALATQREYIKAARYYTKAANYKPNKVFTPTYLTKAALAYEESNNYKAALSCYKRIIQDFPDAMQYIDALKHVARLKAIGKYRLKNTNKK